MHPRTGGAEFYIVFYVLFATIELIRSVKTFYRDVCMRGARFLHYKNATLGDGAFSKFNQATRDSICGRDRRAEEVGER